uniref:Uncharacterized protein n=1 Tax=Oryza brachyantha TaxID=4533 RepID=J3MHX1_ORYBR
MKNLKRSRLTFSLRRCLTTASPPLRPSLASPRGPPRRTSRPRRCSRCLSPMALCISPLTSHLAAAAARPHPRPRRRSWGLPRAPLPPRGSLLPPSLVLRLSKPKGDTAPPRSEVVARVRNAYHFEGQCAERAICLMKCPSD